MKRIKYSAKHALWRACPILLLSDILSVQEKVTLTMATTPTKHAIVLNALAGSGKTHALMEIVRVLGSSNVLMLSFTNAAVRVVKERGVAGRTFDSLFHETARRASPWLPDSFEALRRLALDVGVTVHQQYVIVDEAQDTPPEAARLLAILRDSGRTRVIIAGDPNQAIFQFMESRSLFPLPEPQTTIQMRESRRCSQCVAALVRERFALPMVSVVTNCDKTLKTVVFQARRNQSLAQLYVRLLFLLKWRFYVHVADAHAFEDQVVQATMGLYRIDKEEATAALQTRRSEDEDDSVHLFFSTVHGYKGSEADITVLHEDVYQTTPDNLQYVAITRARFGVLDLGTLRWTGPDTARSFLSDVVFDGIYTQKSRLSNTSIVTSHPVGRMRMILGGFVPSVPRCTHVRWDHDTEIRAILASWVIRASGFTGTIAPGDGLTGFRPHHDRRYKRIFDLGVLSAKQHANVCRRLSVVRLKALVAMYLLQSGAFVDAGHPWMVSAADGYRRLRQLKRSFRLSSIHAPSLYRRVRVPVIDTAGIVHIAFHVEFKTDAYRGRVDMVCRDEGGLVQARDFSHSGHLKAYVNGCLLRGVDRAATMCAEMDCSSDIQPPNLCFSIDTRFFEERDVWDEISTDH